MGKRLGHHLDLARHIQAPLRSPDTPSDLTRALLWPVCRWFLCRIKNGLFKGGN